MRPDLEPSFIHLAPFHQGRGKKPGSLKYGSVDPTVCSPAGPSPAIPKYTRCKPGCDCKKCELDRLADARQRALCVELRRAAGRDEGYRQVMRKAK